VEEMIEGVKKLRQDITAAKERQAVATTDIKRIEKDMKEFSSNKGGKLAELETSLEKLKKTLAKNEATMKPLQQALREHKLEVEQCGSDMSAAHELLQETELSLKTQREEVADLEVQQKQAKVGALRVPKEIMH